MSTFFKLLNFEFNRFFKLYMGLFVFMFVFQIGGTIFYAFMHKKVINDLIRDGLSQVEIIEQYGLFSLVDIMYSLIFLGPIFIGVVAILFYTFFIWYRDWLGKNTFIYRLLTLPTTRMNVYFAKLTTIFLTSIGLTAFQLIIIFAQSKVIQLIIPKVYRADVGIAYVVRQLDVLLTMFPISFIEFIGFQLLGVAFTAVIFTAILFERSYRFIGNIYGGIFIILMVVLFFSPILIQILIGYEYLYMSEVVGLMAITGLVIFILSLFVSRYLLNKKVTV